MDKLLTPVQLAALLQIKQSTVYKWVHYQYIPYIKIGDLIRFRESTVEKWINNRSRKGRVTYKMEI